MRRETIKITDRPQKFNRNHRLEDKAGLDRVIKVLDNDFNELIDCRIYWSSTFATCTCCLWVRCKAKNVYIQGSGKAGGCGYCKKSAAVGAAIDNAGINLNSQISGVGMGAVRDALTGIAKKVSGKRAVHVVESYS